MSEKERRIHYLDEFFDRELRITGEYVRERAHATVRKLRYLSPASRSSRYNIGSYIRDVLVCGDDVWRPVAYMEDVRTLKLVGPAETILIEHVISKNQDGIHAMHASFKYENSVFVRPDRSVSYTRVLFGLSFAYGVLSIDHVRSENDGRYIAIPDKEFAVLTDAVCNLDHIHFFVRSLA